MGKFNEVCVFVPFSYLQLKPFFTIFQQVKSNLNQKSWRDISSLTPTKFRDSTRFAPEGSGLQNVLLHGNRKILSGFLSWPVEIILRN